MDDIVERRLRALIATKQLEVDTLKNTIRKMQNANSNRQRSNPTRKKAKGITKSSDSN
jgi:hypothetical protein